jgi:hypothetical protein
MLVSKATADYVHQNLSFNDSIIDIFDDYNCNLVQK